MLCAMNARLAIPLGLVLGLGVGCRPAGSSQTPGECLSQTETDACNYVHAGCCYVTAEQACTAAGCPGDCAIAESFPAQPVCN